MNIRVAVGDPLGRPVADFVSLPASLPVSVPVSVLTGGATRLGVSPLVSHTFPPLHLLDPLHQLGVVGVDVVVRLLPVVSSGNITTSGPALRHYGLTTADSLYSLLGHGRVILAGPGADTAVETEEHSPGVFITDDLSHPGGQTPEDLFNLRLQERWRIIKVEVFRG